MAKNPVQAAAEIYQAVGEALSNWNQVEDALCIVFCLAMKNPTADPGAHAFWAINSFDAKLKMTDAVVCARFRNHKKTLKQWSSIRSKLGQENSKRNKFAHGAIMFEHKKGGQELVLVPFLMKVLRTRQRKAGESLAQTVPESRIRLAAIRQASGSFLNIAFQMEEFWELLRKRPRLRSRRK